MLQQLVALLLIVIMLIRLSLQKQKKQVSSGEFYLWLFFWISVFIAIVFLKKIDLFVKNLGFSASGIDVLLYFAVIFLFSEIFRLRLKIEKQERTITQIVREVSLSNKK